MSQAQSNSNTIAAHEQILRFPKGQKPSFGPNEWLIWSGSQDEGGLPDLKHGKSKVLVPFAWWVQHHYEIDVQAKTKSGHIGVWFAADDDILKHADVIEQGKSIWPLVAAHFPIFRDGRSFSTAALLRDRFQWTGEIRAIGDVLIDQLLQGARVGFDSFALRPDQDLDVALRQFDLFSVTTQNSWRGKRSLLATI
ncbi:DUF934 domain-containing protein [Polynucleobacter sp. AP-Kolm-20A-A1]|uniref:DUF934 domain-containing protein n=1 Tax=Polynucleobacter sp. AP-Kolm-20A-A1 TaxID=2081041 RepID=UPI001BFE59F7|nr:DUF934 domain-containing protein [Polynucleobacter sp. AP-Kolm-20A-A1]QWE20943.1 DUF934 domain-containing protein [Polynucleobacter sp. AP-Kolm-20A-A1]